MKRIRTITARVSTVPQLGNGYLAVVIYCMPGQGNRSIGMVALLVFFKPNVPTSCEVLCISGLFCMFEVQNTLYSNEAIKFRFTGKPKLERHKGASPSVLLKLRLGVFCSDLSSIIHSKFFTMQNTKNEWAVSEVQLSYKPAPNPVKITGAFSANEVFQHIWDPQLIHIQEQFYALFLNQANEVLCWRLIGTGTGKSCQVDNKLLASIACKCLAQNVIIAHNHPSGNLKPSASDKRLTWQFQKMLRLLDIELTDHLLITTNNYYSFQDHNLI